MTSGPSHCAACVHFDAKKSKQTKFSRWFCKAYPQGIPERYWIENKSHKKVQPDQQGDFVWKEVTYHTSG